MKKVFQLFIITLCIGIISCKENKDVSKDTVPGTFRHYINKFKILKLPLVTSLKELDNICTKDFGNFDENSTDTLYMKNMCTYYGMLPDTSNYYAVIVLYPADDACPVIITYDKTGKKICEEGWMHGGGYSGGGPGIEYYSTYATIKSDLTIYSVDTLKIADVDSTTTVIDSTRQYFYTYQNGKINTNGKITMEAEKKVNIKL